MSFADEILAFEKFAENKTDEEQRSIALELFGSIIKDTPVDEGRLRGNWIATTAMPSTETLEVNDKSGAITINKMSRVVMGSKGEGSLFMTNNLPYAEVIEMGGPGRTPRRMVGKNVLRVAQNVRLKP